MRSLTEKQKSVLDFIEREIRLRRQPPTIKEVARHIGSDNTRSGLTHIEALIRKGFLERSPGQARSLRLTGAGVALYGNRESESRREVPLLVDRTLRPDLPDTYPAPGSFFPIPPDYAVIVDPGCALPEADIREGDILFVQKTRYPLSGGIVLFRDPASGKLLPGMLTISQNRFILRSPALLHEEKEIRRSEFASWIQGHLVALFRPVKRPGPSSPSGAHF